MIDHTMMDPVERQKMISDMQESVDTLTADLIAKYGLEGFRILDLHEELNRYVSFGLHVARNGYIEQTIREANGS